MGLQGSSTRDNYRPSGDGDMSVITQNRRIRSLPQYRTHCSVHLILILSLRVGRSSNSFLLSAPEGGRVGPGQDIHEVIGGCIHTHSGR